MTTTDTTRGSRRGRPAARPRGAGTALLLTLAATGALAWFLGRSAWDAAYDLALDPRLGPDQLPEMVTVPLLGIGTLAAVWYALTALAGLALALTARVAALGPWHTRLSDAVAHHGAPVVRRLATAGLVAGLSAGIAAGPATATTLPPPDDPRERPSAHEIPPERETDLPVVPGLGPVRSPASGAPAATAGESPSDGRESEDPEVASGPAGGTEDAAAAAESPTEDSPTDGSPTDESPTDVSPTDGPTREEPPAGEPSTDDPTSDPPDAAAAPDDGPPPGTTDSPSDAAAPPAAAVDRHIVTAGESLWSIAADQLGPTATDAEIAEAWPRWYAANLDVIGDDPDLVRVGTDLAVPASTTTDRTSVPTDPAPTTEENR